MKKITSVIASLFACASIYASSSVYFVDLASAYSQFNEAKTAQEQIQASMNTTKAELENMDKKRQEIIKEIQAVQEKLQSPALGEDAKKQIAQDAQPKVQEVQQIEANMKQISQQANQKLQESANSIRQVHMEKIRKVAATIAAEKKADYIVDKSVCLFADPKADLTEELVKRLNASSL